MEESGDRVIGEVKTGAEPAWIYVNYHPAARCWS